jgi:hypothetical protein
VKVLEARGLRMLVEIEGASEESSALLSHLVNEGIKVVRFGHPSGVLEERYRQAFGARPQ